MRTRILILAALAVGPSVLAAQVARAPRVGRRPVPPPAELPPTSEPIARAVAYQQSRWSAEGYTLMSMARLPQSAGYGSYVTLGAGTHAGYRIDDRFSATVDLASSLLGAPISMQSAEVGTRFQAVPAGQGVRPFVDIRAAYVYAANQFNVPGVVGGVSSPMGQAWRYSRGFGAIGGAGFEAPITNSFAFTAAVNVLRGRMNSYSVDAPTSVPTGERYGSTTYRLALGLKYAATRSTPMAQKPH